MRIAQIWTANKLRNYNYLIGCPSTGMAIAVDPLDHEKCLARAQQEGWQIKMIVNTHEHADHTAGNEPLRNATGAQVWAHADATALIDNVDHTLVDGDLISLGDEIELHVMDTPGHTMAHICLYAPSQPVLLCGDTLFNAGAGNCHNGGHPEQLFATFMYKLAGLPDATRVYPGHDYLQNNLSFAVTREPDNETARSLLQQVESQHDPGNPEVSTIGLEKQINPFMRLSSPSLIEQLQMDVSDLSADPTPKDVFLALRALRNKW